MPDTIFALSSGRPPAAISVIRISGPRAHEAGSRLAGELPPPRLAAVRELRHPRSHELLDEALVLRFDFPASSTGENVVEYQCHGGRAVVDAVLDALTSIEGLRLAQPGEFTRRAFENGRIDLTEAEGLADLIEAETESQRKAALALAEGGLSKQVNVWRDRLLGLSAEAERAIDYDEAGETPDPAFLRECERLGSELRTWLAGPRVERLKDGVRVVVAGPPNAGKSSLLNVITGEERAIVTEMPGTTRDHIDVPLALRGVPILLTDTAGLRDSKDEVEAIGVARAEALAAAADVLANPSHSEGSPYVLLESMSSGLPIVATAVGGVPEMVTDNESGLLVPARDPDAMAEALARVLADQSLARRLSANAEALARNRFSSQTYVQSLLDVYRQVARAPRP